MGAVLWIVRCLAAFVALYQLMPEEPSTPGSVETAKKRSCNIAKNLGTKIASGDFYFRAWLIFWKKSVSSFCVNCPDIHNSSSWSALKCIWDSPVAVFSIFLLFTDLHHSSSPFLEKNDAFNVHYPVKCQQMTMEAFQSLANVLLLLPCPSFLECERAFYLLGSNIPGHVYLGTQWRGNGGGGWLIWHSWREQSFSVCAMAGLDFGNEKCGEDYWGYFIVFFEHVRHWSLEVFILLYN